MEQEAYGKRALLYVVLEEKDGPSCRHFWVR